jgi:hypothetical protein
MTIIATILGITSGFILAGTHRAPLNMLATSLVIDASLAPLTALIAARRGRSVVRWAVVGFLFGVWAFAWVMLWGERRPDQAPSEFPPTSDAA